MGGTSGSFWIFVGSGIGMILATVLLALVGSLKEWASRKLPGFLSKWVTYPSKKDAEQNHRIYKELVELRALTKADRSYLMRFHNGEEFLPDTHVWKITRTHEVVRDGVSYESPNIQAMIVSRVHDLVDPLLTGSSSNSGIKVVKCDKCPFEAKCEKTNRHVMVVHVDEMENSFGKFTLDGQNIKTMVQSGIVRGGRVYGLVGVDFCGVKMTDENVLLDVARRVCYSSDRTNFYLQNKDVPVRPACPGEDSK